MGKSTETKSRFVVAWGWGQGKDGGESLVDQDIQEEALDFNVEPNLKNLHHAVQKIFTYFFIDESLLKLPY